MSSTATFFLDQEAPSNHHTMQSHVTASQASQKPVVVVVVGNPGTGKTTYAHFISVTYSLRHFALGDLLRERRGLDPALDADFKMSSASDLANTLLEEFLDQVPS